MHVIEATFRGLELLGSFVIVGVGCGVFGYLLADQIDTMRDRLKTEYCQDNDSLDEEEREDGYR